VLHVYGFNIKNSVVDGRGRSDLVAFLCHWICDGKQRRCIGMPQRNFRHRGTALNSSMEISSKLPEAAQDVSLWLCERLNPHPSNFCI